MCQSVALGERITLSRGSTGPATATVRPETEKDRSEIDGALERWFAFPSGRAEMRMRLVTREVRSRSVVGGGERRLRWASCAGEPIEWRALHVKLNRRRPDLKRLFASVG